MNTLLLLLHLGAGAHADFPWAYEARRVMPDAFAMETAMERVGVVPSRASTLYGASRWGSDPDGDATRVTALGWVQLSGELVADPYDTRASGRHCSRIKGRDPVPGGRRVVPVPFRPGTLEQHDSSEGPVVVLGSGEEGEYVLVQLQPGDVIQVTDGVRGDDERWERLEIRRASQRLTLTRKGSGALACYETDNQR